MGDHVYPELIQSATWVEVDRFPGLLELRADDDTLLGWVQRRPDYCDRGHYQAQIEFTPGNPLNAADGMSCYYMRLSVAKQELREKLLWRCCKIRAE